jgi:hypothetical protein
MKPKRLLRAILPDVLIDNFDIVNFDKSADRFDIYLDEKKVQLKEDKTNPDIISYGFGEYRTIQDYPIPSAGISSPVFRTTISPTTISLRGISRTFPFLITVTGVSSPTAFSKSNFLFASYSK